MLNKIFIFLIILIMISIVSSADGCVYEEDDNCDGCVTQNEIGNYITNWLNGGFEITIQEITLAIFNYLNEVSVCSEPPPETCFEEGEIINSISSPNGECCDGLTKINNVQEIGETCTVNIVAEYICTNYCGDWVCYSGENSCNCLIDCPKKLVCNNDGICSGNENADICPTECYCGDGVCDGFEKLNSENCQADCDKVIEPPLL